MERLRSRRLTEKEFPLKVRSVKPTSYINWRQILIILISVVALLSISEQLSIFAEAESLMDSSLVESEGSSDVDDLDPPVSYSESFLLQEQSALYWSIGRSVASHNPHFCPEARAGPLFS